MRTEKGIHAWHLRPIQEIQIPPEHYPKQDVERSQAEHMSARRTMGSLGRHSSRKCRGRGARRQTHEPKETPASRWQGDQNAHPGWAQLAADEGLQMGEDRGTRKAPCAALGRR